MAAAVAAAVEKCVAAVAETAGVGARRKAAAEEGGGL
jgi:hypothetical protein